MALTLSSPEFSDKGSIPAKFTCDGKDQSPPLQWDGVPDGTKSFALIVDDPDAPDPKAPKRVWVHWVLYNIPAETRQIAEASQPTGCRDGKNDWGKTGYGGPCPPIGRHRYFFKLYALDAMLPDLGTPTKAELAKALQGHVLEKVEIIGTYERPK